MPSNKKPDRRAFPIVGLKCLQEFEQHCEQEMHKMATSKKEKLKRVFGFKSKQVTTDKLMEQFVEKQLTIEEKKREKMKQKRRNRNKKVIY